MKTKRQKQRAVVMVADRLVTARELARECEVSVATVRRWNWEGLPHYRRGRVVRYSVREVRVWLATSFGPGRNQHCSYQYR